MSINVSDELLQKVKDEEVEEELYAGNDALTTDYAKVEGSSIPEGYDGVVIGLAVSSEDTALFYLKVKEKHKYENGLNCGGLSDTPEAPGTAGVSGVGPEVPLLIKVPEKVSWEIGFKATAGTPSVSWRLRIRLFKK